MDTYEQEPNVEEPGFQEAEPVVDSSSEPDFAAPGEPAQPETPPPAPQPEPAWQTIGQPEGPQAEDPAYSQTWSQVPPQTPPQPQGYGPQTPPQPQAYAPQMPPQGYGPQPPYQTDSAYRGAGVGRKESPFADSPYVLYRQPAYNPPPQQSQTGAEPPKKPKKKGRVWRTVVAAVLVVALVAGGCGITAFALNSYWAEKTELMTEGFNQRITALQEQLENSGSGYIPGETVTSEGMTPSMVYQQNYQSVVLVTSESAADRYGQIGVSTGSGFIFSENGYVVTNCHVVQGGASFTVTTYDDEEYEAQLIGYDENNDVALLKIDAEGLPAVAIGDSDLLNVGDMVTAIGNPLGTLTSTQTVGYVSAKDRSVTTDGSVINMIQTDCAINSGNSGGPLFNMRGEVVGITSAKYSGTTSTGASIEGISFAIPINDVLGMIEDLAEFGYVKGAYLGVTVQNMDSSVTQYGIPVGAYVREVVDGYCAAKAGVQAGDVIIRLGGYDVGSTSDLTRALRKFEAGDEVIIEVFRAGQELQLKATLDEKPNTTDQPQPEATQPQQDVPQDGGLDDWIDRFFGGLG